MKSASLSAVKFSGSCNPFLANLDFFFDALWALVFFFSGSASEGLVPEEEQALSHLRRFGDGEGVRLATGSGLKFLRGVVLGRSEFLLSGTTGCAEEEGVSNGKFACRRLCF